MGRLNKQPNGTDESPNACYTATRTWNSGWISGWHTTTWRWDWGSQPPNSPRGVQRVKQSLPQVPYWRSVFFRSCPHCNRICPPWTLEKTTNQYMHFSLTISSSTCQPRHVFMSRWQSLQLAQRNGWVRGNDRVSRASSSAPPRSALFSFQAFLPIKTPWWGM